MKLLFKYYINKSKQYCHPTASSSMFGARYLLFFTLNRCKIIELSMHYGNTASFAICDVDILPNASFSILISDNILLELFLLLPHQTILRKKSVFTL